MVRQTLLLADDSPDTHELVKVFLMDEMIDIVSVHNGDRCLAEVQRLRPDLVLLDVDMPGKDGFDVCRHIKSDPRTRDTLIAFLSGAVSVNDKLRGLELGAVDYITKPFDPAELRARVRAALRMKQLLDLVQQERLTLAASEERFRVLAENSSDVISRHSPDGRYLYVSPACKAALGYDTEELIGRSILDLVHLDDLPKVAACYRPPAGAPEICVLAFRIRNKDGRILSVESAVRLLHDPATGAVREIQASMRDQTLRLQAEELERERTSLRHAIGAMEQVLGVVGHELRTPLAALRAMSELVLMAAPPGAPAEREGYISQIHQEVVRMIGTVNNLLEAARLNSGQAKWNFGSVAVAEICQNAADTVRPLINSSAVSLTVDVDPPDLSMSGDGDAIRRLVINLLSNAQKHTTAGRISVEAKACLANGSSWIEIRVSDTGAGMSPEIMRRLGEPFALNSGIVGANYVSGTGLGVGICKAIAAAHGGSIRAESTVGVGTTIIVQVRTDLSEPALEPALTARAAQKEENTMPTIMIVDDAPIVREPIAAALRMAGYQTVCASNGQEAIWILESKRPDLVLLDLAMPTMDGATFLKKIREKPATAMLPVIVLTAGTDHRSIASLGKWKPNDCLFKSGFSLPELITRVQKHLTAAAAPAEATAAK